MYSFKAAKSMAALFVQNLSRCRKQKPLYPQQDTNIKI